MDRDRDKELVIKKNLEDSLDIINSGLGFKGNYKKEHILDLCKLVGITQEALAEGVIISRIREREKEKDKKEKKTCDMIITKTELAALIGVSRVTLDTYACVKSFFARSAKHDSSFSNYREDDQDD